MSILLFAVIVLIVVAMCVHATAILITDAWVSRIVQGGIIIVGALVIMQRAGVA